MQGTCALNTGCRGARLLAWLILNDRVQPSLIAGVRDVLHTCHEQHAAAGRRGGHGGARRARRLASAHRDAGMVRYVLLLAPPTRITYTAAVTPLQVQM